MVFELFKKKRRFSDASSLFDATGSYRITRKTDGGPCLNSSQTVLPQTCKVTSSTLKKIRRQSHVANLSKETLMENRNLSKSLASLVRDNTDESIEEHGDINVSDLYKDGFDEDHYLGYRRNKKKFGKRHLSLSSLRAESFYNSDSFLDSGCHSLVHALSDDDECLEKNDEADWDSGIESPNRNVDNHEKYKIIFQFLQNCPDMDHRLRNVFKWNNHVTFHSNILCLNVPGENTQSKSSNEALNNVRSEIAIVDNDVKLVVRKVGKVLMNMRQEALVHLAAIRRKKKRLDQFGDDIQDVLKGQKHFFKFNSFCSDHDNFTSLVIKVELRLSYLDESDSDLFTKSKLLNQIKSIRELKLWMDERERVLTEVIVTELGSDYKDTFKHFIDTKQIMVAEMCLVGERLKQLDTMNMVINNM